jgi:PmbA protein
MTKPNNMKANNLEREEMASYILRELKKQGADDVIVSSQLKNSLLVKFSNNKVNTTKTVELDSTGIFMSMDKRLVTANLIDQTKSSADATMKKLVQLAKISAKNEEYLGIAEGKFKYQKEANYDKKLEGFDNVELAKQAIDLALDNGSKRSSGTFETTTYDVHLLSSNNIECKEQGTKAYFSMRCFTDKDASGHMVAVSRTLANLDWKSAVEKAADIARTSRNPQQVESGKYDIIFDYLPYANILNTAGSSASIFSVESGLSFFAGKLGKNVGSSIISLSDDPTQDTGFNFSRFDAEGVPCQRNTIIEKGVLKTYLHNTSTAKRYKTKTTANAGLISPSPFNLILEPGNSTLDEMISSIKNGIYITNVWYTRFQNYMTGDFSTIPRDGAFLIKNGKMIHPVKDIRVSDNIINILRLTTSLTKESKQIYGWEVDTPITTPMALVKGINITKSEK